MDNYAIQVLEKEIYLIEKCLSDWEVTQYKEAKIERELKLNQLKTALKKLAL